MVVSQRQGWLPSPTPTPPLDLVLASIRILAMAPSEGSVGQDIHGWRANWPSDDGVVGLQRPLLQQHHDVLLALRRCHLQRDQLATTQFTLYNRAALSMYSKRQIWPPFRGPGWEEQQPLAEGEAEQLGVARRVVVRDGASRDRVGHGRAEKSAALLDERQRARRRLEE